MARKIGLIVFGSLQIFFAFCLFICECLGGFDTGGMGFWISIYAMITGAFGISAGVRQQDRMCALATALNMSLVVMIVSLAGLVVFGILGGAVSQVARQTPSGNNGHSSLESSYVSAIASLLVAKAIFYVTSTSMAPAPVCLHVYDIFWTNNYTHGLGLGFYHSGVEVYGHEYGYGGHPFDFSGLLQKIPKDESELGEKFRYKETVFLGYTTMDSHEVDLLLKHLSQEWFGCQYNLVSRNCNHFSSHLSYMLCGRRIPRWVNRIADTTKSIPMLERVLPKQWLRPFAAGFTIEDILGENVDPNRLHDIVFCNRIPTHLLLHRGRSR